MTSMHVPGHVQNGLCINPACAISSHRMWWRAEGAPLSLVLSPNPKYKPAHTQTRYCCNLLPHQVCSATPHCWPVPQPLNDSEVVNNKISQTHLPPALYSINTNSPTLNARSRPFVPLEHLRRVELVHVASQLNPTHPWCWCL